MKRRISPAAMRLLLQIHHVDGDAALFEEALRGASLLRILHAENLHAQHVLRHGQPCPTSLPSTMRSPSTRMGRLIRLGCSDISFNASAREGGDSLHVALAVEFVAGIQEVAVVALADQLVEFLDRQSLVEIDLLKLDAFFAKQTLRVAAGGSSGFQIEFHGLQPF